MRPTDVAGQPARPPRRGARPSRPPGTGADEDARAPNRATRRRSTRFGRTKGPAAPVQPGAPGGAAGYHSERSASLERAISLDGLHPGGALIRAEQPWLDAQLAELYDAFPFADDLPLYVELAQTQGGAVLELCCGSGRLLVPLAEAGQRLVGVDASGPMLAIARRKLAAAGPAVAGRARLVQADLREFRLDQQFDLVLIAVKSFAYLTERAEQLAALRRVYEHLRPGGLLALDLLHPRPDWLARADGSVWQDLAHHDEQRGLTVARTETVVSTDLARQIRVMRSVYEIVSADGSVRKRLVEWPFRFTYRYEAEHLLERAGFSVEAVYGGYRREPFETDSSTMLLLARR